MDVDRGPRSARAKRHSGPLDDPAPARRPDVVIKGDSVLDVTYRVRRLATSLVL